MAMSGAMSADPVCIYDASGDEREVAKEEREEGEEEEEEEENEDEQSDQRRICTARFNLKLSWNQSTTLRLPVRRAAPGMSCTKKLYGIASSQNA